MKPRDYDPPAVSALRQGHPANPLPRQAGRWSASLVAGGPRAPRMWPDVPVRGPLPASLPPVVGWSEFTAAWLAGAPLPPAPAHARVLPAGKIVEAATASLAVHGDAIASGAWGSHVRLRACDPVRCTVPGCSVCREAVAWDAASPDERAVWVIFAKERRQ